MGLSTSFVFHAIFDTLLVIIVLAGVIYEEKLIAFEEKLEWHLAKIVSKIYLFFYRKKCARKNKNKSCKNCERR